MSDSLQVRKVCFTTHEYFIVVQSMALEWTGFLRFSTKGYKNVELRLIIRAIILIHASCSFKLCIYTYIYPEALVWEKLRRERVCLGAFVSEGMCIWMRVCLVVCVPGSKCAWLHVCLVACVPGCMCIWVRVCLGACLCGAEMRIWVFFILLRVCQGVCVHVVRIYFNGRISWYAFA